MILTKFKVTEEGFEAITETRNLLEFPIKYININQAEDEVSELSETETEEAIGKIRRGGLIHSLIFGPIRDLTGKILYHDLECQRSEPDGKVTEIPYWSCFFDSTDTKRIAEDSEMFEQINENFSPYIVSKIGNNFIEKTKLTHEDWYLLLSELPKKSLNSIMFPLGPTGFYKFWNFLIYSTLAEGDNNLNTDPSWLAWARGFASLSIMAYKLSNHDINFDMSSHNVLSDQYCLCCQHSFLELEINLLPAVEQTYSLSNNCFIQAYDLECMQNFNNFVMNKCVPSLKDKIIAGLLSNDGFKDEINILKIFVKAQDFGGLGVLQRMRLNNVHNYPNAFHLINLTEHRNLTGLEDAIKSQLAELKFNTLLPADGSIIMGVQNSNTYNFMGLMNW